MHSPSRSLEDNPAVCLFPNQTKQTTAALAFLERVASLRLYFLPGGSSKLAQSLQSASALPQGCVFIPLYCSGERAALAWPFIVICYRWKTSAEEAVSLTVLLTDIGGKELPTSEGGDYCREQPESVTRGLLSSGIGFNGAPPSCCASKVTFYITLYGWLVGWSMSQQHASEIGACIIFFQLVCMHHFLSTGLHAPFSFNWFACTIFFQLVCMHHFLPSGWMDFLQTWFSPNFTWFDQWLWILFNQFSFNWSKRVRRALGRTETEFVCWLVALRPSNRLVYLRDGSARTVLRADTLRQKLQIQLSTSPSRSILTPGRPVPALTL